MALSVPTRYFLSSSPIRGPAYSARTKDALRHGWRALRWMPHSLGHGLRRIAYPDDALLPAREKKKKNAKRRPRPSTHHTALSRKSPTRANPNPSWQPVGAGSLIHAVLHTNVTRCPVTSAPGTRNTHPTSSDPMPLMPMNIITRSRP